jgi:hypothetical protein
MLDPATTYQKALDWFEYANGQTYGSNGWAIAAAFGIFIYVMKDAADRLLVVFGVGAAVLLVVFAGCTAAGCGKELDAAFQNLLRLEKQQEILVVSQDPDAKDPARRSGSFGSIPIGNTIYLLTGCIAAGFVLGGWLRIRSIANGVDTSTARRPVADETG